MFWLVPRPASLKETVSDPLLFRFPLALMKCSFCANAAEAAKAKSSMDSTAIIPTRLIYFLPSFVPMAEQGRTGIDWKRSLSRGDVRGSRGNGAHTCTRLPFPLASNVISNLLHLPSSAPKTKTGPPLYQEVAGCATGSAHSLK